MLKTNLKKLVSQQISQFSKVSSTTAPKKENLIKLKINNIELQVKKGTYLIDAIRKAGFDVPTMCFHSDMPSSGGICRICLVCDKSKPDKALASCKQQVWEGMDIDTMSEKMNSYRQANTAMLFSHHPSTCITCVNAANCEGEKLCAKMDFKDTPLLPLFYQNVGIPKNPFLSQESLGKHPHNILKSDVLCINCDRCLRACEDIQNIGVYGWLNDKDHNFTSVGVYAPNMFNECIQCGQCILHCPVGALYERSELTQLQRALKMKDKKIVFVIAPTIKIVIGEEFGLKPGQKILKNELVQALKTLDNNIYVSDASFSADLTIMEEAHELIARMKSEVENPTPNQADSFLPMFTSCCPGWVDFTEKNYPEYLNKLSSCKSPQLMMGASIKSYFCKKYGWDRKNVVTISIMPCTAKKLEKDRSEMQVDGDRDIDISVTTREICKLFKQRNIDPLQLQTQAKETVFDTGNTASGAGMIFAVTGGVCEAACRTAYEAITGKSVPTKDLDLHLVRGLDGIKSGELPITETLPGYEKFKGKTIRVAIAHTLRNARIVCEKLKECEKNGVPYPWDFIEIMACRGGCLGGGGQPKPINDDIRQKRASLVYTEDKSLKIRKSHECPEIIEIYENFFGKPHSELAHKYLHTHYFNQRKVIEKVVSPQEAEDIKELISNKFPAEKPEFLLEILLCIADKYGYISEQAIREVSKFCKVQNSAVVSTASYYIYVPLRPVGENVFYICQCQNCQMKGSLELEKKMENWLGIKMGETTKDGKYSLKKANWLGWCVNGAPGMMLKRKGTSKIVPITGALKLGDISEVDKMNQEMPENNIKLVTGFNPENKEACSFFEDIDLKSTLEKAIKLGPEAVLKELEVSGLQGRGGAGFPAAIKWASVRKQKEKMKYVVINADEGLPCTFKDWFLLKDEKTRTSTVAGAMVCAWVSGASEIYFYLRYEYRNISDDLMKHVEQIKEWIPEFKNIKFLIRMGLGPYVEGERTALYESIEGKGARPRTDRNQSSTRSGLFKRPTVTNNVETITAVPYIINKGGKLWANHQGINGEKGVKLYSVSGDTEQPTVVEGTMGQSFRTIIEKVEANDIVAAECGGATEYIIQEKEFDLPVGFKRGALGGVGSIVLFNGQRNIGKQYLQKMEFLKDESCQQCVPCREGSKILAQAVHDHVNKLQHMSKNDYIDLIGETVEATSICGHGQGLGKLFLKASKYFKSQEQF